MEIFLNKTYLLIVRDSLLLMHRYSFLACWRQYFILSFEGIGRKRQYGMAGFSSAPLKNSFSHWDPHFLIMKPKCVCIFKRITHLSFIINIQSILVYEKWHYQQCHFYYNLSSLTSHGLPACGNLNAYIVYAPVHLGSYSQQTDEQAHSPRREHWKSLNWRELTITAKRTIFNLIEF